MSGLARNFAYGFGEKYLQTLMALAASMLLARLMTPAQLGVYGIAAVLTGLVQVLRDFGTGQLLVAQRELGEAQQRALLTLSVALGWMLAITLAVLAAPVAGFYGLPGLCEVLRILSLNFLIVPFASQISAMLRRDMRAAALFRITASYCVTQFCVTIVLAVTGLGPTAMAWGSFAATVAGFCAAFALRPAGMAWRPDWLGAWRFARPGSLVVASNAIDEIGVVAPELVAGKLLGPAEVALLGKAQSILSLFNQAVTSALTPVVFPLFARTAREGGDPVQTYLDAAACITALSWPFFLMAGLFAAPLVEFMYGPQWTGCVPLIRIICGASALYSMFSMVRYLLLATGHSAAQARLDAVAVLGRLILLLPAGFAGLRWLAAAVALSLLWRSWLVLRILGRLYGLQPAALFRHLRQSVIVAAAAMAPPAGLLAVAGGDQAGSKALFAAAALGVAGWGSALYFQRRPLAAFIRQRALQR